MTGYINELISNNIDAFNNGITKGDNPEMNTTFLNSAGSLANTINQQANNVEVEEELDQSGMTGDRMMQ